MPNIQYGKDFSEGTDTYMAVATHSYTPNTDIAPFEREDLQKGIKQGDKKLLQDLQKKEAQKKYYSDTLVSFGPETSAVIDTNALPSVKKSIEYYESLKRPKLPEPKLSEADSKVPTGNLFERFINSLKSFFSRKGASSKERQEIEEIVSLSSGALEKIAEIFAKMEAKDLERMNARREGIEEDEREDQEKKMRSKEDDIYESALWIKLLAAQIQYQEEKLKSLAERVDFKQEQATDSRKEYAAISDKMEEKERKMKPAAWIKAGATAAQVLAGGVSTVLLIASLAVPGGAFAAPVALKVALGAISGISGIAKGATQIYQADIEHDLNVMMGKLKEWRHEDEQKSRVIEEMMKSLSEAMKTIQSHWDEIGQLAKMKDNLAMGMVQRR